jgi:hypothetical protein
VCPALIRFTDTNAPFCWQRDTLYPLKLTLISPTSGGRSVGIVRLRTEITEFFFMNPYRYLARLFGEGYRPNERPLPPWDNTHRKIRKHLYPESVSNPRFFLIRLVGVESNWVHSRWSINTFSDLLWVVTPRSLERTRRFGGTYQQVCRLLLLFSWLAYSSTLKMEAMCSFETSGVTTQKTVLFWVTDEAYRCMYVVVNIHWYYGTPFSCIYFFHMRV